MDKLNLINQYFEKKILLNKEILDLSISEEILNSLDDNSSLLVLNKEIISILTEGKKDIDWQEFDKYKVNIEKGRKPELYFNLVNNIKQEISANSNYTHPLKIISSYLNTPQKHKVKDFTKLFISRYKFIESILRNRRELANILSINKILNKKEKENISLIGVISEINQTRNGNTILTLEDLTGKIKVMIYKDKKRLYNSSKELVFDEVIGINGTNNGEVIFAENIVWPEIPADRDIKKYSEDIYSLFLSDIHIGSTNFLADEFDKFLSWINQETGNETQKQIAKKIKYIFIAGDLVDGVGIYPNQDKELIIKDIYQQYQAAADLLKKIPSHIQIIVCPGNHDAIHLAEPQPAFNPKYIQPLIEIPNLVLVSNPALINICKSNDFPGFDILLYHGYSFDYYINNVDPLRNAGGYSRADLIMKFLLKKRHLAPSCGSTPYLPTPEDS